MVVRCGRRMRRERQSEGLKSGCERERWVREGNRGFVRVWEIGKGEASSQESGMEERPVSGREVSVGRVLVKKAFRSFMLRAWPTEAASSRWASVSLPVASSSSVASRNRVLRPWTFMPLGL